MPPTLNHEEKKQAMKTQLHDSIRTAYADFIVGQNHPCVMANTVFQMENYQLRVYDDIESASNTESILKDISAYLEGYDLSSSKFESLILCFEHSSFASEGDFERALWALLQRLHEADSSPWDPKVSADPDDANFSFSLGGTAFYIIGMHPVSSRLARRAPYCTVVLNLHWQFEKLREMGSYDTVRNRIRRRDEALQGSINPALADFGNASETRQYSGRNVEPDWKCPFRHKN
ncbi:guanitoxin biosynthesis heme-dependent pre-guanitoxin N-hydroxylase GntA [Flavobacterium qiangtangense]|uniref:Guanitoxin biosynthesis heme-dependent pre-guanitoxin N-hydroxylase GntA n=1 Tax=Flavobacterium qiangtangense TaxID=1442595 RepID=A0ABW1PKE1_9FLAO